MKQLHLLFPYSLPPDDVAKDLQAQLKAPHFATLLGLTRARTTLFQSDYARAHIHEYILSGELLPFSDLAPGQAASYDEKVSPATSYHLMQQFGLLPETGYWFLLQPVHLHVALDHLVLTDSSDLKLSESAALTYFEMARAICEDYGHQLLKADDTHWFLRADDWSDFVTSSLNAACGHNIDIWMAEGAQARNWRKLQNEIQMQWFCSDLHQQREMEGLPAINSLWLSHGSAQLLKVPSDLKSFDLKHNPVSDLFSSNSAYYSLDRLELAWLNADWYSWLRHFEALDNELFAPIQSALDRGEITQLGICLTRANHLSVHRICAKSWWQFWRKPDLSVFTTP